MAVQTLTLEGWQPAPLNVLMGLHWAKRMRRKNADCAIIALEAIRQGITRATGKRRVTLRILWAPGRGCIKHGYVDGDALWKTSLDALVRCGVLLGDGPDHVETGTPTHEQATRKGLVITLEDLG